ncbi:hypothetical protein GCM10009610_26900 [Pseudonocardia xinjiangensis]
MLQIRDVHPDAAMAPAARGPVETRSEQEGGRAYPIGGRLNLCVTGFMIQGGGAEARVAASSAISMRRCYLPATWLHLLRPQLPPSEALEG